jgi:hypothetical protein
VKCIWDPNSPDNCVADKCQTTDADLCRADPNCDWKDVNCAPNCGCIKRPCTQHNDDFHCNRDPQCHWSTAKSPGSCQVRPCVPYTEAECKTDPTCIYDTNQTLCVTKTCAMIKEPLVRTPTASVSVCPTATGVSPAGCRRA